MCVRATEWVRKQNATTTVRCVAAIENERTTSTERELFIDRYCMCVCVYVYSLVVIACHLGQIYVWGSLSNN